MSITCILSIYTPVNIKLQNLTILTLILLSKLKELSKVTRRINSFIKRIQLAKNNVTLILKLITKWKNMKKDLSNITRKCLQQIYYKVIEGAILINLSSKVMINISKIHFLIEKVHVIRKNPLQEDKFNIEEGQSRTIRQTIAKNMNRL